MNLKVHDADPKLNGKDPLFAVASKHFYQGPAAWDRKFCLESRGGIWDDDNVWGFLGSTEMDDLLVSLPPALSSPGSVSMAELKQVKELSMVPNRPNEEIILQANFTLEYFVPETIDAGRYGNTRMLFIAVLRCASVVSFRLKEKVNRARPYQMDSSINALFYPGHPSFPSGHATQIFSLLETCKDIWSGTANEQKRIGENVKLATKIARNRESAGVHFPSDTNAGILLAELILHRIRSTEKYNDQMLPSAKEEWRSE
jgi:PAP2 superfamily